MKARLLSLLLILVFLCLPVAAEKRRLEDNPRRLPATPAEGDLLWAKKSPYGPGDDYRLPLGDLHLDLLDDVALGTPASGEVLTFDGTSWTASPVAAAGLSGDYGDFTCTAGTCTLDAGTVSANELDEAGVEAGLELVLDLQDLQGAVTDAQVPDTITIDLATSASDLTCTDCIGATEIADVYVLNTTDAMSGDLTVAGTLTGTTAVVGPNVTSGADPGHTHTSGSIGAAGSDTEVLYNDGGAVDGDPEFTYDKTTDTLTVEGSLFVQAHGNVTVGAASGTPTTFVLRDAALLQFTENSTNGTGYIELVPPANLTSDYQCQLLDGQGFFPDNCQEGGDDDDPESIDLETASMATGIADDEVPVGTASNTLTYKAVPDCDTGKLLYDTATNAFSCGTDAVGFGGGGGSEYHPDNYPPAGDLLMGDEFTSGLTLTWTEQDLDSAATSVTLGTFMSAFLITGVGSVDDWQGATTTVPADSGADWFMVAKVNSDSYNATTRGCGISLITGGTAAVPTEINSMYLRATSSSASSFEHLDHDDYGFGGPLSMSTEAVVASASEANRLKNVSFYVYLHWIDATEDIGAGWSWDGFHWSAMTGDATVDGYPVASGIFARDNMSCIVEWVRFLDTDVDVYGVLRLKVGG